MHKPTEQIARRFAELETQGRTIRIHRDDEYSGHADSGQFYAWASSVQNALHGSFGPASPHYSNFQSELSNIPNNYISDRKFQSMLGIFLGAKSDIDGGYLFDIERSLTGEVFGDFVVAAKAALNEGAHTVAAVLACAALEDALKRFATANGLSVENETMEGVVNALKSKGLVGGAQKTLLATMPKIRNYAMHADWDKLTPQDAAGVVGFVEQFLLTNFA